MKKGAPRSCKEVRPARHRGGLKAAEAGPRTAARGGNHKLEEGLGAAEPRRNQPIQPPDPGEAREVQGLQRWMKTGTDRDNKTKDVMAMVAIGMTRG